MQAETRTASQASFRVYACVLVVSVVPVVTVVRARVEGSTSDLESCHNITSSTIL